MKLISEQMLKGRNLSSVGRNQECELKGRTEPELNVLVSSSSQLKGQKYRAATAVSEESVHAMSPHCGRAFIKNLHRDCSNLEGCINSAEWWIQLWDWMGW